LYAIAVAMIVYGVVIVASAWLSGTTRYAVAVRRRLAPTLRERPGTTYGAVAFVYLLVLAWGPTPALRNFIPIVLIGVILALGVAALRTQAAREFPDVPPPDDNGKPPIPPTMKSETDLALGAP
jgi:hypothetical protein